MRTCEPSGFTRNRMSRNCSGVDRRVGPMMLALIAWPGAAGSPPIAPTETCTFCARMAATTSLVVRP